jgi:hypothetical protein
VKYLSSNSATYKLHHCLVISLSLKSTSLVSPVNLQSTSQVNLKSTSLQKPLNLQSTSRVKSLSPKSTSLVKLLNLQPTNQVKSPSLKSINPLKPFSLKSTRIVRALSMKSTSQITQFEMSQVPTELASGLFTHSGINQLPMLLLSGQVVQPEVKQLLTEVVSGHMALQELDQSSDVTHLEVNQCDQVAMSKADQFEICLLVSYLICKCIVYGIRLMRVAFHLCCCLPKVHYSTFQIVTDVPVVQPGCHSNDCSSETQPFTSTPTSAAVSTDVMSETVVTDYARLTTVTPTAPEGKPDQSTHKIATLCTPLSDRVTCSKKGCIVETPPLKLNQKNKKRKKSNKNVIQTNVQFLELPSGSEDSELSDSPGDEQCEVVKRQRGRRAQVRVLSEPQRIKLLMQSCKWSDGAVVYEPDGDHHFTGNVTLNENIAGLDSPLQFFLLFLHRRNPSVHY